MTLTYTLTEYDFLQHQLFIATKSQRIKNQRLKTWLIYSVALLLFSLMFYQSNNTVMMYYFLIVGIAFLCVFPFYQRWYYKNHYRRFITDNYKNRFGRAVTVTITSDGIETSDFTGESKINLSELESTIETGEYFYVKMRTSGHLIIPKMKLTDIDGTRKELKDLCKELSIRFTNDLNWKWR